MSAANERLAERLKDVPSDVLADLLLKLTKGNPALKRHLVAITSDTQDLISAVKRGISGIKRSTTFYPYHQAHKVRTKLNTLVSNIDSIGKTKPSVAFELLCELHTCEDFVVQNVDDSSGFVGQIFKDDLPSIAASITSRYHDEAHIKKWLGVALEKDPYNSGCELVDAIASTVPETVLRDLLASTAKTVASQPREPLFESRELAFVQRRLLVALGETEAFIACCTYEGGMVEPDIVTLIQMYKDHEQQHLAQPWIDLLEQSRKATRERYEAQARELSNRLTEQTALREASYVAPDYRSLFLQKPSEQTLKVLRLNLSFEEVESVLDEFVHDVEEAKHHTTPAFRVLIAAGRGAEAESIAIQRCTIDHAPPQTWNWLAKLFEAADMPLGATVAYRVILENQLESRHTTGFYYAKDYYEALWRLAPLVNDWRSVTPHNEYYAAFCARYADKKSFWIASEFTFSPPTVSRFAGGKKKLR